jgi:hypothetical protein
MSTKDLSAWFFTGVWQWILMILPGLLFYVLGGSVLLGISDKPLIEALVYVLLVLLGFVLSGWAAQGAVARVGRYT